MEEEEQENWCQNLHYAKIGKNCHWCQFWNYANFGINFSIGAKIGIGANFGTGANFGIGSSAKIGIGANFGTGANFICAKIPFVDFLIFFSHFFPFLPSLSNAF